jgi:hypothetical protein
VTDLFLTEQNRLDEQQIGVFDDVLILLIQRIETQVSTVFKSATTVSRAVAPLEMPH